MAPRPKVPSAFSPIMSILWFTVGFAAIASLFTGLVFGYWAAGFLLLLVGSAYVAVSGYVLGTFRKSPVVTTMAYTTSTLNIAIAVIALVGLLAMFYDRTALRGIDYVNLGMAAARAEFNSAGERGGIISIFGNLFSAAVYLPLINVILDWERWGRERLVVLALVIIDILGLTYITGGRTALLIAIAIAGTAMLARGAVGMRRLPGFLTLGRLVFSIFAVCIVFGAVFALRATAFGAASSADYLSQLCFHLSQPTTEIMVQCSSLSSNTGMKIVDEVINYGIGVLLYAFHVAWVGDSVISATNPGTFATFAGIQDMFFSRFGFQVVATDYDGYFIPGSASLVYDFGFVEMVLGFLALGFLIGIFRNAMIKGGIFIGRVPFCFAGGGLILCVLISPANLPVLILSIMSVYLIALAINVSAVLRIVPLNIFIRKFRRVSPGRGPNPR